MAKADKTYAETLYNVLYNGEDGPSRPGVDTRSIFGAQMRFDLRNGEFPLLTTKKVNWYAIVQELLWFLRGETNVRSLQEAGVHIWDEWADSEGNLGPVYGSQWRNWNGIDQIADLIKGIRKDPMGRRHIVTAWNPAEIPDMKLPPCHCLFQFKVMPQSKELNLQLYQRSADMFLGVPFNIASYALLLRMVAQVTGYKPGEFIWTGGDVHIYHNHFDQVKEQLSRDTDIAAPAVGLDSRVTEIDDFTVDDIYLVNYTPLEAIKGKVAV